MLGVCAHALHTLQFTEVEGVCVISVSGEGKWTLLFQYLTAMMDVSP